MSDEVQRIAGAIARLSQEEKEHLFDLLDRFAAAELHAHPREESVRILGH